MLRQAEPLPGQCSAVTFASGNAEVRGFQPVAMDAAYSRYRFLTIETFIRRLPKVFSF
jgi:hypothetical protein